MKAPQVRRLSYAMGAEVRGVDLNERLSDADIAELRALWLEHIVLAFPDQHLEDRRMMEFCARFGPLDDNSRNPEGSHPDYPHVKILCNKPSVVNGKQLSGETPGATRWHSDQSYTNHPAEATFLLSRELPEVGGDTLFANMYLAYDTLSDTMKSILEGLSAVHDRGTRLRQSKLIRVRSAETEAADLARNPPVVHPAVRIHPETKRKALFVNPRVSRFAGMTEEESKPLLDFLNRHAVRYEFVYQHSWTLNAFVMWDNRCAIHLPIANYDVTQTRRLIRCMISGPESGAVYRPEAPALV